MDNRDINFIACHGNINLLMQITSEIANSSKIDIVKEPYPALIMLQVEESVAGIAFNAGEIYALECEVKVNDVPGFSCIINEHEPDRAYYAAILSAAFKIDNLLDNKILKSLKKELDNIKKKRLLEFGAITSTKVKFEVMEV